MTPAGAHFSVLTTFLFLVVVDVLNILDFASAFPLRSSPLNSRRSFEQHGHIGPRGNLETSETSIDETPSTESVSDQSPQSTSRRQWIVAGASSLMALHSFPTASLAADKSRTEGYRIQKTPTEWRSILSPIQYDILRNGATERPYSSILESEKRSGTFYCAGCDTPLFDSKAKFKSGTGWPSFATALEGVEVEDVNAVQANLAGAELRCKTCGGHLGDVFNDGFLFVGTPAFASGKRYCIDGAALIFRTTENGIEIRGDASPPPPSSPSWLDPPKINARES